MMIISRVQTTWQIQATFVFNYINNPFITSGNKNCTHLAGHNLLQGVLAFGIAVVSHDDHDDRHQIIHQGQRAVFQLSSQDSLWVHVCDFLDFLNRLKKKKSEKTDHNLTTLATSKEPREKKKNVTHYLNPMFYPLGGQKVKYFFQYAF